MTPSTSKNIGIYLHTFGPKRAKIKLIEFNLFEDTSNLTVDFVKFIKFKQIRKIKIQTNANEFVRAYYL